MKLPDDGNSSGSGACYSFEAETVLASIQQQRCEGQCPAVLDFAMSSSPPTGFVPVHVLKTYGDLSKIGYPKLHGILQSEKDPAELTQDLITRGVVSYHGLNDGYVKLY